MNNKVKLNKMPKVITNEKVSIGAYLFHDRKNPSLCIKQGAEIVVYNHFNSIEQADEFMDKLAELCGVVRED